MFRADELRDETTQEISRDRLEHQLLIRSNKQANSKLVHHSAQQQVCRNETLCSHLPQRLVRFPPPISAYAECNMQRQVCSAMAADDSHSKVPSFVAQRNDFALLQDDTTAQLPRD